MFTYMLYKFQFSIQTFIFFFIKRLRYQKDDSLVSYYAQFLSENLRVVEIILYVNFLSSRKYDWNVAPKDLEKYGAPTAHASFFLKKIKVYLLQLLLLKIIKQTRE